MEIYGITPVDSALSALGLNLSQGLMNFLFHESKIGYLCFCIGFCYHIYRCTKQVNYRPLLVHFSIFIACLIIVGTSARHEGNISSAWEAYCLADNTSQSSSICMPPRLKAQILKSQILDSHQIATGQMPALLSFLGQSIDAVAIGIIAALNRLMPEYAQYLKHPFGIQDMALDLHRQVSLGVVDLALKSKAQDFIYTQYLPALIILRNSATDSITNLSNYGPSSERITNQYSQHVKAEWGRLRIEIQHLINTHSTWPQVKLILNSAYPRQRPLGRDVDDDFIDALMRAEAQTLDDTRASRRDWLWQLANGLLQSYPYAQGLASLSLYVFFPLVLCLVLTFARVDFLFYWIKSLIWVKSWILTAGLAYWVSLLMSNAQAQIAGGIKWFWQEPYFALGAGILVYLMPLMLFFLVFKGVHFKYQQLIKEERHAAFI